MLSLCTSFQAHAGLGAWRAHLLQIGGVGQERLCAARDEVVNWHQDVLKVINGPLVVALVYLRPERPYALRDLRAGA